VLICMLLAANLLSAHFYQNQMFIDFMFAYLKNEHMHSTLP
jgi:hypothetical protein